MKSVADEVLNPGTWDIMSDLSDIKVRLSAKQTRRLSSQNVNQREGMCLH